MAFLIARYILLTHLFVNSIATSYSTCYNHYTDTAIYCSPPVESDIVNGVTPVSTSTCGSDGPELVCPIGSVHSCDTCSSPESHPASFMTDGLPNTYWRSQTYGSNGGQVNITISLGKRHYIQKISILFEGPRPESFALFASNDGGVSYRPLQYFSQSCQETYGIQQGSLNSDGVPCVSEGTGLNPLSGGSATFVNTDNSSPSEMIVANNLLLRLDRPSTLGNERTWSNDGLSSYSYAISSLTVEGGCFCNGHADACITGNDTDATRYCSCQHNTTGVDCELCAQTHNDQPWQPALDLYGEVFQCKACECNGRSESCEFDLQAYTSSGNRTGGVCMDCRNNTNSKNCQKCAEGFYPVNSDHEELKCEACVCDPRGVVGGDGTCETARALFMAGGSTSCDCKPNVQGNTCNTCIPGYHTLSANNTDGCQACECSVEGSLSSVCDEVTGQCTCKSGYYGTTCQPCNCNSNGTIDMSLGCDETGVCQCDFSFSGDKCDVCYPGYYNFSAGCQVCDCHYFGSVNSTCDVETGQCYCKTGFSSSDCSVCPDGFHDASLGCAACPDCFNSVSSDFNTTENLLKELIMQTNITLSNSVFHSDLIDSVEDIRASLLGLLEMVLNLTQREVILSRAVNETMIGIDMKVEQLSSYSRLVRVALFTSMSALDSANSSRNEIDNLFRLFTLSRADLLEIRSNLTAAQQLLEDILQLRQELIGIAAQSDSLSRLQNQTVRVLLSQSDVLLDNSTMVLADICEAVENENVTLVHLRGARNCTLPELDQLLTVAQSRLQYAVSNSSSVLNRSIIVYDRVLSLIIPDYDSESLIMASERSLGDAEQLLNDIESLTNDTQDLEDIFKSVNDTAQFLSTRIQILNSSAVDLIDRSKAALNIANASVVSAEIAIQESESILLELNRRLSEILEFLSRYNELLRLVERAENVSALARDESTRQYTEVQRIVLVVNDIDRVLQTSLENLNTAIMIISEANATAFHTLTNVDMITNSLETLSDQFQSANESLQLLEERSIKDREAINEAEFVATAASMRADTLENNLQNADRLIDQLAREISNVTLIPQSRYTSLKRSVDSIEIMITDIERSIDIVSDEVSTLQEQSEVLERRYNDLKRHRDLLNDILANIEPLNCIDNVQ